MKKRRKNSFIIKILEYVESFDVSVILRKDVAELGDSRQVSRALKALVEDGYLIKIGYGVYAKAEPSNYLDKPVIKTGFTEACIETLNRLGVDWGVSEAMKNYNAGITQQVPFRFEVRLKSRFRRKLAHSNRVLGIEGMIYAK